MNQTPAEPRRLPPPRMPPLRDVGVRFLHLAVLSGFAIAQPLFQILGRYPAFFAAHDSSASEVVGFALVVALGPPLALLVIELVLGLAFPPLRQVAHLVFVWGLSALFFLQVVDHDKGIAPGVAFLVAALLGLAAAVLYARAHWARTIVSYAGFAPVLFLVLFLFVSNTSKITLAGTAKAYSINGSKASPPIVLVMLDAFPAINLVDPQGHIDRARFPSFAQLARDGTWYRNATTAHENTVFSVPSILDGNWPRKGTQPIVADHPNNLFTLLGKTYEINADEQATNLCPPGLCHRSHNGSFGSRMHLLASDVSVVYEYLTLPRRMHDRLPPITDRWAGFRRQDKGGGGGRITGNKVIAALRSGGRPARFISDVQRIRPTPRPQLNFMHVFLPHEPRDYLADGQAYQRAATRDSTLEGTPSYDNTFLTRQSWQRDLLQMQYADRLVGIMLDRLRKQGLYDKTMIIVTSDHGESFAHVDPRPAPPFVPGKLGYRRAVTPENIEEIAPVLLFVKYPNERRGKVDKRFVKLIDVLPTVASALGIRLPFRVDGHSLLDPRYRGMPNVRVERTSGPAVTVPISEFERKRRQTLALRFSLFGWGAKGPGIWGFGPDPELHGRPVSSFDVDRSGGPQVTVQNASAYADVDPDGGYLPALARGSFRGDMRPDQPIAVALNGTIVATGLTFAPRGRAHLEWGVMLPPTAFRRGRNTLQVFGIEGPGQLRLLGGA